jgi:hypothetical protein
MTARLNMRLFAALAAMGFMAITAISCGIDTKVNELINPPVPASIPTAIITVDSEAITPGTAVMLSGSSSSDPQGKTLTYAWTLEVPNGSLAALTSATSATTSFSPDKNGQYLMSLTVTNSSSVSSSTATTTLTATGTETNNAPVAVTTAALTGTVGASVVLDGSTSSDADGDTLSYAWTMIGVPSTSAVTTLTDTTSASAYFTPDVEGTYNIKFVVSDGTDASQALVTVTVTTQTVLTVPTASFTTSNTSVVLGTPVTLNATASSDPQGLALTYAWSLEAPLGSLSTIAAATSVITSFTPDKGGTYLVYLTVRNSSSIASATATATVDGVGTGTNHPPVAITTTAVTGAINIMVVLDGSSSYDADQNALSYTWSMIGVPATSALTVLTDDTLKTAYFTPDVAGTYNIKFEVSDGTDSDQVFVTVTAQ